ncbi:MAG TPA: glucose 1-dehydrogenase [Feifaniaceae bacterium]|nr:glucose 1-dehydrogenase [Feifaniaceae bacterium]
MLFDIKGKNAIVTGASRGIGYGIAKGFAEAGANLICICRSMPEDVLEEFRSFGVRAEAYSFDLSEPEKIPALVEKILQDWGRIDILINNAGAQRRNNCADFTDEDWDFVMNVNAKSVFVLCREVGRHMVQRGSGKIVNFASLLSFQGGYRVPAYSASKGAVMQFTKTFANEWAKLGVNVNCIAPGYIDTEMNVALVNDPARNEQITTRIPAGRWGHPEDLVGAAIFLCSPASDYVHGTTLIVDGGWMGR